MTEPSPAPTGAATDPLTVCVDRSERGAWEVTLRERCQRFTCATLEDAKHLAYRSARRERASELIVRDAYHRVVQHQLLSGSDAGARAWLEHARAS